MKKVSMDESELESFRPVSNLSFMSKIIKKIVARQLIRYLDEFDMIPKFQSGFRAFHSAETTLARLLSDIHMAMDRGDVTLLALLDVSAAFDSVDHDIFVNRLRISFEITGRALNWLNSFIHGRAQSIVIRDRRSHWRRVRTGVLQGSVLGPLLYVLFTSDVPRILAELNLGIQQYADNTQGYVHGRAENAADSMGLLQDAILKIESWMSSNRLKFTQNKTQYIWIGTQFQLAKSNKQQLARMFPGVDFLESVVDLGVVIDQELRMDRHIGKLSQSCFYQLRQLRTVRQSLSDTAAKMLFNSFVVTRIDYCNIVLTGASASNILRIQRIMNAAARLQLRLPKFSHISAVMTSQLHWLPAHRRIQFKLLLMVASCIAGQVV